MSEFRRRLRLQTAASLIERTAMPLATVAHEAGFSDQPHLCREFRDAAGVTPGAYRRLVRD